jgi:hypothetical protein
MNCDGGALDSLLDTTQGLTRVQSTTDFSKIFPRHDRIRLSTSASTGDSEDHGSENSQVLFMTTPKRQKRSGRSFSEISYNSVRKMDGPSEGKPDAAIDAMTEELASNVIDREIYEWQYVCETGRPYWWSPEQKYHRLRRLLPRKSNEISPWIWMRDIDERPKGEYDSRRRSVSESFQSDPDNVHTLAHMIAIQLLSSCFTLPPDHVLGIPSPNYQTFDKAGATKIPDPRMISSLRMHTHFRYSPCFGHQARNTSPVQLWPSPFDGQSQNTSASTSAAGTGFQTPDIGTSGFKGKRNRGHRTLHVTEGSTPDGSFDDGTGHHGKSNWERLDPTVAESAWRRRRSIHGKPPRSLTLSHMPGQTRNTNSRRGGTDSINQPPAPNSSAAEDSMNPAEAYRGADLGQHSTMNYRMHSVIRSEPHHVFVQPVRELVVKRWKTFRRRFGGSLHSPLPVGMSEDHLAETSETARSGASSPVISNDGRTRRQRAQERGDIHSSSVNSTTHYNSPVTGCATPDDNGVSKPFWVDSAGPSPTFQLADPLSAAAALAAAESVDKYSDKPRTDTPSSSGGQGSGSQRVLPTSTGGSPFPRFDAGILPPLTSSSTRPYSRRGSLIRRSMLSEVHTPDDFVSVAAAIVHREPGESRGLRRRGSLASPLEHAAPLPLSRGIPQAQESLRNRIPNGPFKLMDVVAINSRERPRLSRTSTSGTQVFHPDEEGVEIDGLPVGPGRDV